MFSTGTSCEQGMPPKTVPGSSWKSQEEVIYQHISVQLRTLSDCHGLNAIYLSIAAWDRVENGGFTTLSSFHWHRNPMHN